MGRISSEMRGLRKTAFVAGLAVGMLAACILTRGALRRSAPVGRLGGDQLPVFPSALAGGDAPTRLAYRFSWEGFPAAILRLEQRRRRGQVEILYEGRTVPELDRLWRFRLRGRTVLEPPTYLPVVSQYVAREGERRKSTHTAFDRRAGTATVIVEDLQEGERERHNFAIEGDVDVAGAMHRLRAARGGGVLNVLVGDDRYTVAAHPLEATRVETPAGSFPARRWWLAVRRREEGEREARPEQPCRAMHVWVGEERRIIVRMEAAVFVGRVVLELTSAGGADLNARPALSGP